MTLAFLHLSVIHLVFFFCVCVLPFLFLCDNQNLLILIAFLLVLFKGWLTCCPRGHFANPRRLFVEPRIFPHLAKNAVD